MAKPFSQMGEDNPEYAIATTPGLDRSPAPPRPSSPPRGLFRLPTLARFLADFTLGFADGLTVPFALTAGLSSLGRTDTVIYAGMAEICAGSISMGIGGYLAARGEVAAAAAAEEVVAESYDAESYDAEDAAAVVQEEKGLSSDVVTSYLAPLDLPLQLHEMVLRHIRVSPAITEALLERQMGRQGEEESEHEKLPSPFMAGSSVAVGYLLGGLLPLFPYLVVDQVKDGLLWSFVVCAVALFVFGFCKDFALSGKPQSATAVQGASVKMPWSRIRHSAWEGAQMVLLGSVAALAAVLCVRAFEGIKVDQSEQTS
jgi:VIT1/CCC1 family predicted Fe2+/Mn2+ transporter